MNFIQIVPFLGDIVGPITVLCKPLIKLRLAHKITFPRATTRRRYSAPRRDDGHGVQFSQGM